MPKPLKTPRVVRFHLKKGTCSRYLSQAGHDTRLKEVLQ